MRRTPFSYPYANLEIPEATPAVSAQAVEWQRRVLAFDEVCHCATLLVLGEFRVLKAENVPRGVNLRRRDTSHRLEIVPVTPIVGETRLNGEGKRLARTAAYSTGCSPLDHKELFVGGC